MVFGKKADRNTDAPHGAAVRRGRWLSAAETEGLSPRRVSAANLKVERFGENRMVFGKKADRNTDAPHGAAVRRGRWLGVAETEGLPLEPQTTPPSGSTPDSSPYTGEPERSALLRRKGVLL